MTLNVLKRFPLLSTSLMKSIDQQMFWLNGTVSGCGGLLGICFFPFFLRLSLNAQYILCIRLGFHRCPKFLIRWNRFANHRQDDFGPMYGEGPIFLYRTVFLPDIGRLKGWCQQYGRPFFRWHWISVWDERRLFVFHQRLALFFNKFLKHWVVKT